MLVAASVALVVQTAARPAEAESPPTLDEHFTLTLRPPRDYAIRDIVREWGVGGRGRDARRAGPAAAGATHLTSLSLG